MNVMALQCPELEIPASACGVSNDTIKYPVAVKQCSKANDRQHLMYDRERPIHIHTKLCSIWKFYLQFDKHYKKALHGGWTAGQTWGSENRALSWTAIT